MTVLSVSNLSIQSTLTTALQAETSSLTQLSTQLSTGQKHSNLTDYSASDALNLMSLQSAATQTQAYLNVINTVNSNLSVYNTTLTDLEFIASQAQSLSTDNPNYSSSTASNVLTQATNYLTSVTVDLNQQINGRFIYSGTRYTTQPVQNLATLPADTLSSTIETDNSTAPSYDTASSLYTSTSGQDVTINGTAGTGQVASIEVNGTTYNYTVLSTDTPTTVATALAGLVTAGGVTTTSSGATLTVAGGNTINSAGVATTNTASYTTDTATIADGYTVNYGISANNPAMQQLIAGLRYLQAAGNATDSATYQTDVNQAASLLSTAVTSLQGVNTDVASNMNTLTQEQNIQNTAINNITNQVDDISQVDVTQVSTEITALQAILQASYAVTGDLERLSIVSYLPT